MSPFYPIKLLADWLTIKILQLSLDTHLGEAVHFFIYDSIKIFILLLVIIFAVSLMRTYFPPNKIRQLLAHKNQFTGHLAAAGVGIITPFCTCSAIPLFLGLLEAGVPLGVTMSFLIASPLINEVALVLLWGMFGWQIALIYIFSGYLIAGLSGFIIGRLKLESLLTNLPEVDAGKIANRIFKPSWRERLNRKRRGHGHGAGVYDGSNSFVLAGIYDFKKSDAFKIDYYLRRHRRRWNYVDWLFV